MANKKGKVCYFLVCFQNVEFVSFLLAALYRPDDLFIVHSDLKSPPALTACVRQIADKFDNIVVLESRAYSWAGYSHVQVTLDAMVIASSSGHDWSHFVCLSEQHLPLMGPDEIADRLIPGQSMNATKPASEFSGAGRLDLLTRFVIRYDELAGCGCFATELSPSPEHVLDGIHHGSNWFLLARPHVLELLDANRQGEFARFKHAVHAEETAMQTVLRARVAGQNIRDTDPVLVAHPHLTDNSSLVMTDALFWKAVEEGNFFIRKRQSTLSSDVAAHVKANNFSNEIYKIGMSARQNAAHDLLVTEAAALFDRMQKVTPSRFALKRLDHKQHNFVPRFHAIAAVPNFETSRTVRIVSENLSDFRVTLIDTSRPFIGFLSPFVENGVLFSTLRLRLYDFAFNTDLLPLNDARRGRVNLPDFEKPDELVDLMAFYVEIGSRLKTPERLLRDDAP